MYIGSNIGERIREEKVSGKTRVSNLKADADDGLLNRLDPRPDTRLLWAVDWALEGGRSPRRVLLLFHGNEYATASGR